MQIVKKCARVYLEAYTSILLVDPARLEEFYGRPVLLAHRDTVETEADQILAGADSEDVALLVVGDPLRCAAPCLQCTIDRCSVALPHTRTCSSVHAHSAFARS